MDRITPGATDQSIVFALDTAGLTIADMKLGYIRWDDGDGTSFTETLSVALTALATITTAHTDNRAIYLDADATGGNQFILRVDFPDAAFASGKDNVICNVYDDGNNVIAHRIFKLEQYYQSNVKQISDDATAADNLEAILDGTGAAITLKSSAQAPLHIEATGGNYDGMKVLGNGTGHGLNTQGGATGNGVQATGGATSGNGMNIDAGTSGDGLVINGAGGNSNGISSSGVAFGNGMQLNGGATGNGLKVYGGATSGSAIYAEAQGGNGHGMEIIGDGTGDGINSTGGATSGAGLSVTGVGTGHGIDAQSGSGVTGDGIYAKSNATVGRGLYAEGGTAGVGLQATGGGTSSGINGTGGGGGGNGITGTATGSNAAGIRASGAGTGPGINSVGGATSGNGITATGGGTGHGIYGGSGTGATGDGMNLQANSTNGRGLYALGNGTTGEGIRAHGAGANATGISGTAASDGDGISGTSDGTGVGILASSAQGSGMQLTGSTSSGNNPGLSATGGGSGAGWKVTGGAGGLDIDAASIATASGEADAGSSSTDLVDAARTEADDYWNGQWLVMKTGANAGLARLISDFVAATDTITVNQAFPNAIASGDDYEIKPAGDVEASIIGDVNVTKWNGTTVTGDGDWAELQTDVDAILVDTGTTLPATLTTIEGKIDTVDTVVDAILVDTGTTLPATLTTIEGKIDTVDTVVDAILVDTGTTLPATLTTIESKIDTVDTVVDAILVDTGTTLPATLTTIEGKVDTVDTVVDSILVDTADMQPKLGAPSTLGDGATISDMLTAMAGKTASAATYNRADDSLEAIRDRGDAAWSSASATWTATEKENIRQALGVDGTKTAPTGGYGRLGNPNFTDIAGDIANLITRTKGLDDIHDDLVTVDGVVDAILVDTGTTLPATLTTIEGKIDTVDTVVDAILVDTADIQPKIGTPVTDLAADIAANLTAIQNVQNNTRFSASPPTPVIIQETGDLIFKISCTIFDTSGNPEDPDSQDGGPQVAILGRAVNGAANKTAFFDDEAGTTGATASVAYASFLKMVKISTGRFETYYKLPSTEAIDTWTFTFKYAENSVEFVQERGISVLEENPDSVTLANSTANKTVIAEGAWDASQAAHTTGGSMGANQNLVDEIDTGVNNIEAKLPSKSTIAGTNNADGDIEMNESTGDFNPTQQARINTEVDSALDTAIPGSPTANSINERVAAIDDLTEASGAGDLAAIKGKVDPLTYTVSNIVDSNIKAVDDSTDEATRLKQAVKGTIHGKVHTAPLNKNTLLVKSLTNDVDADLNVSEKLKNRVVIFTTGLARGEAIGITSQAAAAADPITLTVTDMSKFSDVAIDDEFVIV